jgi:hypothetical protein
MHVYEVRPRKDKRGFAPESFLIAGWQMIRPQSTSKAQIENNTDVDRWADARRLRINGKPCS